MKKSDRTRNRKPPVASIDGASAATLQPPMSKKKNLSLIFSKLAEFEDQRLDEDFFRIIGDETDFVIPVADFSAEVAAVNEAITCNLDNVENDDRGENRSARRLHPFPRTPLDSRISPGILYVFQGMVPPQCCAYFLIFRLIVDFVFDENFF